MTGWFYITFCFFFVRSSLILVTDGLCISIYNPNLHSLFYFLFLDNSYNYTHPLDEGFVRNWGQGLWNVTFGGNDGGASWLSWLSLQLNGLTLSLGFSLQSSVGLDSVQEFLTTSRVLDVLDSQVNSLLDVSVADDLVDDNTNGRLGNVVDNTSLTVVVLVWHTLLDGTVGLDVNDVTDLVDLQVGGQRKSTMLLEVTQEGVTSTGSVTVTAC